MVYRTRISFQSEQSHDKHGHMITGVTERWNTKLHFISLQNYRYLIPIYLSPDEGTCRVEGFVRHFQGVKCSGSTDLALQRLKIVAMWNKIWYWVVYCFQMLSKHMFTQGHLHGWSAKISHAQTHIVINR